MALHIRLHTGYLANKHMVKATQSGRLLYIGGLAYCVEHLTDGRIPKHVLNRIADVDDKKPTKTAQILVGLGRWIDNGDEWIVHDYNDPNTGQKLASEVNFRRDSWAEKKRKQRELSKMSPGDNDGDNVGDIEGDNTGESPTLSPACPYTDPDPDPDPSKTKNLKPETGIPPASPTSRKRNLPWEAAYEALLAAWPAVDAKAAAEWAGSCKKGTDATQARRRAVLVSHILRLHGVVDLATVPTPTRVALMVRIDAAVALEGGPTRWATAWNHAATSGFWPAGIAARLDRVIDLWLAAPRLIVVDPDAIRAEWDATEAAMGGTR